MDKEIRRHYTLLVDFLGHILGPDYEVALHELTEDSNQIIAISNGELTGRHLGSPLSNKMLEFLSGRLYETQDYVLSFESTSVTGKKMHSNSMFVKDRTGSVVGLLCINFDDSRFHEVSDTILRLVHPDDFVHRHYFPDDAPAKQPAAPQHTAAQPAEHFQSDMNGLMEDLFATVTRDAGVPLRRLTQAERAEIVARLYEQGMFELRGAVQFTVEKLGCSQASVYRYIKNAKAAEE